MDFSPGIESSRGRTKRSSLFRRQPAGSSTAPIEGAGSVRSLADEDLVVIAVDSGDYTNQQRTSTTSGLSAETGARLWQERGRERLSGIAASRLFGTAVVVVYDVLRAVAAGEVELLNRKTGASVPPATHATRGTFGDEFGCADRRSAIHAAVRTGIGVTEPRSSRNLRVQRRLRAVSSGADRSVRVRHRRPPHL